LFIYYLEDALKGLLALLGVGPKTADIVLLFCANKPTFPVETNLYCVSKRLGLIPPMVSYERVRRILESLYLP